jgi:hypothetical protein
MRSKDEAFPMSDTVVVTSKDRVSFNTVIR